MLNACLPSDIRVLAWRPVDASFSARFSARARTYKYFFRRRGLDVDRMRQAAQLLCGEHDLRNFCKIDPSVSNFVRTIESFDVQPVTDFAGGVDPDDPEAQWAFTVRGTAFLYHQVRCMVAVLFLVGEHKEAVSIVPELLDLERTPRRPNYEMASDAPLLLYDIHYDGIISDWRPDARTAASVRDVWAEQRRALLLRSVMLHSMEQVLPLPTDDEQMLLPKKGGKGHVPLRDRPTHESVEVKTKGRAK